MYLYIPTPNSFADDGLGCQLSFLALKRTATLGKRERERGEL